MSREEELRRRLARSEAERTAHGVTAMRGMAIVIKAINLPPETRERILDVAVPKVRSAASAKYAAKQEEERLKREAKHKRIKLT